MKRVLILALLCILILSGCNFQNQNCQTSDVISSINTNSSSSQLETSIPVNGLSLKDLGLQICVPRDIQFIDPNIDFEMPENYSVMSADPTFDFGPYMKAKLYGNYTYVAALTVETIIATMELPVIFLQGFNLEDIENRSAVIMVGQRQLSMEELSAYEVYRDESAVVYNFSSLLMTESFDDYIDIHKGSPTYDYSWTKDVYNYFQNHIQEIIKRK